jgi:hypothetical protein
MKKSSEKAKPKTKKVRFNLYAPGTETVSLAGDLNACVLVIPEVFGMHEHSMLYPKEGFPSSTFEPYAREGRKAGSLVTIKNPK